MCLKWSLDNFKLEIEEGFLKLSAQSTTFWNKHWDRFSERYQCTSWKLNRMSQIGMAGENGQATTITAVWDEQERTFRKGSWVWLKLMASIHEMWTWGSMDGLTAAQGSVDAQKRWCRQTRHMVDALLGQHTTPCPAGQAHARPTQTKVPHSLVLPKSSSLRSFPHIPVLFRALNKVTVQRPMEMAKIIQAELLIILLSANEHLLRRACAKALGWMPRNGGE